MICGEARLRLGVAKQPVEDAHRIEQETGIGRRMDRHGDHGRIHAHSLRDSSLRAAALVTSWSFNAASVGAHTRRSVAPRADFESVAASALTLT